MTPPPTRPDPVASLPAETDLQKRVLGILNELRQSSLESRPAIVEKFASLGEEGALFLATQLPNLDAISMPYAAAFLGRKKEPRTAPILAGHLKHPKPAVRAVSASALGSFGPAAPVSDLLPLLDDADSIVRGSALGAIRQVAPREAFGPVARLAADPAGEIRANAVEALFEIARKHEVERDLAPTLVPLLDRTAGPARATVAGAIGRTGDKQAWSAITPLLRDDSAEVRAAAAQGLETLGAPEAGAAILAAIVGEREKRPRVRLAAAAEKLKVVEAGKAMIPWLEDPDVEVQTAALTALRRLTGQSIGPDPKAWQAYWESAKPK